MPVKSALPASSVIAVDEGDDATSSTLSFTLDASGTLNASTYAWTCTAVPAAGDPAFPNGTTTGAQTIDSPSSATTDVTVTGPGRYVFTVTPDGDASKAQTVSVLVSRPQPAIAVSGVTSGAGTPGATVTPTISDTGGADGPLTYQHTATRGSNGLGMVVTDSTSAQSSLTYPAQTAEGDSIGWRWTLTDAYGRTSQATAVVNLPSPGDFSASTSLGDYVDTTSPYSFAPTLTIPAGATVSTTITRISDASSVSVTGGTTTTPTATCTAADATAGEGFVAKSTVTLNGATKHVYTHVFMEGSGNPPGEGQFEAATSYDYTSDNDTGVTITVGGGDTTLKEADTVTDKGVVRAANRSGSPTSSAVVASDGIDINATRTGSSDAFTFSQKGTASDADFSDDGKVFAVDVVVQDLALTANNDQHGIYLSNGVLPFSTDESLGIQIREVSGATEYRIRRLSNGSSTDSAFSSGVGSITSIAIRWIVYRGKVAMLWQLNATSPITASEAGGSVLDQSSSGLSSLPGDMNDFGEPDPWYIHHDLGPRGTSGECDARVTHFQTSEIAIL